MKVVLTIAGSDTSGGGGIQQDLKVLQACGVHGATVITALTAQSTTGIRRVHRVPPRFVGDQIDTVAADLPIAAVKTGMLDRAAIVEIVAERIRRRELTNLVVDPVILAKDGTPLLNGRGLAAVQRRLLPLARVVTPNVPEAEALSGVSISDEPSLREAARRIGALGVEAVIIKGGHLPGEPVDTLYWKDEFRDYRGARIEGAPVRGTGCLFSAALAAHLAMGDSIADACSAARELVRRGIAGAVALGKGARLVPPLLDNSSE